MRTPTLIALVLGAIVADSNQFTSEPPASLGSQLPPPPSPVNAVPPRFYYPESEEWHRAQSAAVSVRPFRVVTTASVGLVYALLAWRAHGTLGQNPLTTVFVGANVASCCIALSRAGRHKRLLKSVFAMDLCLETCLCLHSIFKLLLPSTSPDSKDFYFASAISSFWFLLIVLTCLRSNWITALPADSHNARYRYGPPPYAPPSHATLPYAASPPPGSHLGGGSAPPGPRDHHHP